MNNSRDVELVPKMDFKYYVITCQFLIDYNSINNNNNEPNAFILIPSTKPF